MSRTWAALGQSPKSFSGAAFVAGLRGHRRSRRLRWAGTESSGKIGFALHADHNLTLSGIVCALKACAWLARVEPQRDARIG